MRTALVAVLLLTTAPGCLVTEKFHLGRPEGPAPSTVAQVAVAWSKQVQYAADPTRGGVPAPGLAGRLYLFGADEVPQIGDGGLVVELYDDTNAPQPGGRLIETWTIDPPTLKRLLKKDPVGWGYTVFLPWGSYNPNVRQVHMSVQYKPANGVPLFAPSGSITLEHVPSPAGSGLMAAAAQATPSPGAAMPQQVPQVTVPGAAPQALPMPRIVP